MLSADDPLFRLMLLQQGVCHIALMAERRVPVVDAAYRWFMRRRWRRVVSSLRAKTAKSAKRGEVAEAART
jgi:hypothetical protein